MSGNSWINFDGSLLFGKYKGKQLTSIAKDDPDYLQWILREVELTQEDEEIISTALQFRGRL